MLPEPARSPAGFAASLLLPRCAGPPLILQKASLII
jgi:hypothetical protein